MVNLLKNTYKITPPTARPHPNYFLDFFEAMFSGYCPSPPPTRSNVKDRRTWLDCPKLPFCSKRWKKSKKWFGCDLAISYPISLRLCPISTNCIHWTFIFDEPQSERTFDESPWKWEEFLSPFELTYLISLIVCFRFSIFDCMKRGLFMHANCSEPIMI